MAEALLIMITSCKWINLSNQKHRLAEWVFLKNDPTISYTLLKTHFRSKNTK